MFYVKAWFDSNHYGIYQSDGIILDQFSPEVSLKVLDLPDVNQVSDVDYIASSSTVAFSWNHVFNDVVEINRYQVSIGTSIGLSDVNTEITFEDITLTVFNGLQLEQNIKYYATVTACNVADLCTSAYSDGFVVS